MVTALALRLGGNRSSGKFWRSKISEPLRPSPYRPGPDPFSPLSVSFRNGRGLFLDSNMAFAGQTPTIVVLKEGPCSVFYPPSALGGISSSSANHCFALQAPTLLRARVRSSPTLTPVLLCSPQLRARSVRTVVTCCLSTTMASRRLQTMEQL